MSAVIQLLPNEAVAASSALFAVATDPPAMSPRSGRSIAISREGAWPMFGVLVGLPSGQCPGCLAPAFEARPATSVVSVLSEAVL
jgi:hypothetical protein